MSALERLLASPKFQADYERWCELVRENHRRFRAWAEHRA